MGKTINKPFTAAPEDEVVVFVIGMRINKWHAVHKWWPVFTAMAPMIKELHQNKDLGFLATESSINFRTIFLIQYWRSFEDLTAYAKADKHMAAWRRWHLS
jgi:heme-degrading monooxygenase HmoA